MSEFAFLNGALWDKLSSDQVGAPSASPNSTGVVVAFSLESPEPGSYGIGEYTAFENALLISGWIANKDEIASVGLYLPGRQDIIEVKSFGRHVVNGMASDAGGFRETIEFVPGQHNILDGVLLIAYRDGTSASIGHLGVTRGDARMGMLDTFRGMVAARPNGKFLEVGSRARSGILRRDLAPASWDYTGLDVLEGVGVDVVGDAHEISKMFPEEEFDAISSFSVFEHLLMPWKVAIELNRVMKTGGIGLITTHQTWPVHEAPWDFWRFSDQAWKSLFNEATGFEILDAQMGGDAYIVPTLLNANNAWGNGYTGRLQSNVIFRKIGRTSLEWNVRLGETITTHYPPQPDLGDKA